MKDNKSHAWINSPRWFVCRNCGVEAPAPYAGASDGGACHGPTEEPRALVAVHKITVMVVDHEGLGAGGVKQILENQQYPGQCINPTVILTETRLVDWHEQHPINIVTKMVQAFKTLFE